MKKYTFHCMLIGAGLVLLLAFRPQQQTFDKITVREFELVDQRGNSRASIKVEQPSGEVVLRLKDQTGTIRVKLGADQSGSGLVLLDGNTEPAIHALSRTGATLTLLDDKGKKREY